MFGVLEQLSAIDLETERDKPLPIVDDIAARLEILCELDALEILCEIDEFENVLEQMVDDDVAA